VICASALGCGAEAVQTSLSSQCARPGSHRRRAQVVFCLPNLNPVNSQTVRRVAKWAQANFSAAQLSARPWVGRADLADTPVAVGIVVAWIGLLWLLFARKTFTGRTSSLCCSALIAAARRQVEIATKQGVDLETAKSMEAKSII